MAAIVTLNQDSPSVQYLFKKDKRLTKVISMVGPITYEPHTDNPFIIYDNLIICSAFDFACRAAPFP